MKNLPNVEGGDLVEEAEDVGGRLRYVEGCGELRYVEG